MAVLYHANRASYIPLSKCIKIILECVSSGTIRKFEWILRQFKEETRRLSSAKSMVDDAEMAQNTPKLRIREFLRHTLRQEHGYLLFLRCFTRSSRLVVRIIMKKSGTVRTALKKTVIRPSECLR